MNNVNSKIYGSFTCEMIIAGTGTATISGLAVSADDTFLIVNEHKIPRGQSARLVFYKQIVFVESGGFYDVVPLPDDFSYSHEATATGGITLRLPEAGDMFSGAYIEVNNTVDGAISSIVGDRPIVVDYNDARYFVSEANDAKTHTVSDSVYVSGRDEIMMPSRAVITSMEITPVDLGGRFFGEASIRMGTNGLWRPYGIILANRTYRKRFTVRIPIGARVGDKIEFNGWAGAIERIVFSAKPDGQSAEGTCVEL